MGWITALVTLATALWLGAWTNKDWGFLVGGLLGYLVAQRFNLARQLDALRQRLDEFERRASLDRLATLERRAETAAPPAAAPAPAPAPAATTPAPTRVAAPPPGRAEPVTPVSTDTPTVKWPPEAPAERGMLEKAIAEGWAWLKGGNPVAKAGIVILFFGAAFLAKYAADHALLPLELRLAGLAAGAVALLVVGWRLRESRALYAQILQGGGIAGLYLVVFAAARLYHLVPHGFALPLLIAIATASALLAVAQGSLALAVIGFAGGFLAPVMLSTGGGNHVALFSYYAVLNLGVFTVAWFRAWRVLNLVGFVFTFTITGAWRALSYTPDELFSADFFLLLFFVMYVGISILFALRQKPELKGYVSGSLVFGLPVVAFTIQTTLLSKVEYGLAFSALGFGAFYLALAFALWRSRHPNLGLLAEAFAALGVIFGSLAIPLAFDHQTTAAMWAVEGAGLLWLGVRQDRKLARAFGALLQLAGGTGYLIGLDRLIVQMPVLNTALIGTLLLAVSGALSARWLQRSAAQAAPYERNADVAALLWATAWFAYGGFAEIDRALPPDLDYGAAVTHAALTLSVLLGLGQLWAWTAPARVATALLPPVLFFALAAALRDHPLAEFGFLGWPLLLGAAYALLHEMDARPDEPVVAWRAELHAGVYAALAIVASAELGWQVGEAIPGVWRQLPWALVPVALLWAANREPAAPAWPVARHAQIYRRHASVPLALWIALWVLAMNLSSAGDPGDLPYLPLLNPLDLTSAAALGMLALYVLGLPERATLLREKVFVAAAGALVFVWLNAALIRALHYTLDAPLSWHGIRHSLLVQASLSIFWTLLGLSVMVLSTRKGWRTAWMAGAGMMAVVVVKLFAIDLAGTGTIARIASFMSVGLLMLLAGYVSPLPPAAAAAPRKEDA
ncbi:MAG: DUF2339 domain-containing protein [Gammaproteobacteria bacterium]